jgi:hypothetical protein
MKVRTTIFIGGWLIAAVAGEYAVFRGLIDALVLAFGNQYVAAILDRLIIRKSLIGVGVSEIYVPAYISHLRATDSGLQFI